MTLVTALLFSSLGGHGCRNYGGNRGITGDAISGIPAATAGGLYLFGSISAACSSLANWVLYKDVLNIEQGQIIGFVVPFAGVLASYSPAFY